MLIDAELFMHLAKRKDNKYEACIQIADDNVLKRIVKFNNGYKQLYGVDGVINISEVIGALNK